MSVVLAHHSYGKSRVRLTKIERLADRHELIEWALDVQLTGAFEPAYTVGDNRQCIATDTMKNIVYALAADQVLSQPEDFLASLVRQYLSYPQVTQATVTARCEAWQRIAAAGQPHPHAFVAAGGGTRTATLQADRHGSTLTAGIADLLVLKTTGSAWREFHRDEFRTLPDTTDRILATSLTAEWTYATAAPWADTYEQVRQVLLTTFANHQSEGVQQTLYAMGAAVLAVVPALDSLTLTMPNRHRLPVNLTPFNRPNTNSVFVATDEPHGLISATLRQA
jgi:urate oxidase